MWAASLIAALSVYVRLRACIGVANSAKQVGAIHYPSRRPSASVIGSTFRRAASMR